MNSAPGLLLLTFVGIHDVIKAERLLLALGLPCDLVPTPRALSSDCGMAIECPPSQQTRLENLRERGVLSYRGLHLSHVR